MEYSPAQIDKRIQDDPEMQHLAQNDETEFLARHEQIYKQFGYKPDGSPLSTATKAFGKISQATGIPEGVVQGVANVPIPMALSLGGAVGGAPLGPGGSLLGAGAGSVAGEIINYKLGLRDAPDATDIGIAAGAPALGPLVSRAKGALSNVGQGLPGAGQHMHNLVGDVLRKQISHMEVSDDMVNFMRQQFKTVPAFKVDVPNLRYALVKELDEGTKSAAPDTPYLKKLLATTQRLNSKKTWSFEDLMATEKDFIKLGAEDSHGIWKKLSGVLITDLEEQAQNPKLAQATRDKILTGVESYKNFVAVNQRKRGQDALDGFLKSPVLTPLDDGLVRFNKSAFLKKLDSEGMKVFEPSEIESMKKAVNSLGYLGGTPKALPGMTHTGSYGAAGLAAYATAGVPGVVGLAAVLGSIRLGLSTEPGRKMIEYMAKNGHGKIDALELKSALGKVTAGMSSGMVAGVTGAGQSSGGTLPFENQE